MKSLVATRPSASILGLAQMRPIWCMAVLSLLCCNRRLAVLDPPVQIANAGAGGSVGDALDAGFLSGLGSDSGATAGSGALPDASPNHPEPPSFPGETCNCAASDALLPLGCRSVVLGGGSPRMSDDGQTLMYIQYIEPNSTDIAFYRWHGGVLQQVPGSPSLSPIYGLSSDGDQVLLGATVYRASDQSTVTTGLRPNPVVMGSDGSVVGLTETGFTSAQLARWTRAGGLQELGDLPFDVNGVELTSTPSQNAIAGIHRTDGTTNPTFRWTQAGGVEIGLPGLQSVLNGSSLAVSRDGTTLTGYSPGQNGLNQPFLWTQGGGAVPLGVLPSGYLPPVLPSGDGSVLAGTLYQGAGELDAGSPDAGQPCPDPNLSPCAQSLHAFRWTQQSGSVVLIPDVQSEASLMSADGSVVVGTVTDGVPTPFYWNAQHGARSILVALSSAGVDVSGWQLSGVRALSADGRIVVGMGSCGNDFAIFRAVLPD